MLERAVLFTLRRARRCGRRAAGGGGWGRRASSRGRRLRSAVTRTTTWWRYKRSSTTCPPRSTRKVRVPLVTRQYFVSVRRVIPATRQSRRSVRACGAVEAWEPIASLG
eukprot:1194296-Prorocentrum_minimum.AAC.7